MNTFIKDGKTYAKVGELRPWDKNPRAINNEQFVELQNRIKRLGQFKPLIVTEDGIIVGGNMRRRAFTQLGITEAWVSVVKAPTDREKFDYALIDNSEMGFYDREQLAELALSLDITPLELGSYEINLGKATSLLDLTKQFGPDDEEEFQEEEPLNVPVLVVVVTCTDQEQQQELADELNRRKFGVKLATAKVDEKSLNKLLSGV